VWIGISQMVILFHQRLEIMDNMKKLAAVVTCVDSGPLAEEALQYLRANSDSETTTLILIDNGSYTPLPRYDADILIRYPENIGGNAVFHELLPELELLRIDVVAYLDCDLMVRDPNWSKKILDCFNADPLLGMVGFVGSNEIDGSGGRGRGTMSSFIGSTYRTGHASPASVHGKVATHVHPAAVLDHCSMIFSLKVLKGLPSQKEIHTPGHFYDRVLSCEILNRGYHMAVVGVACDHFSGGTGNGVINRDNLYRKWLTAHNLPADTENPDMEIYKEGERRFLSKWRDELKFIPLLVNNDYSINHYAR